MKRFFMFIPNRWLIWNILQFFFVFGIGTGMCLNRGFKFISFNMALIFGICYCILLGFIIFDLIKNWKRIYKEHIQSMILYLCSVAMFWAAFILYRELYKPRNESVISFLIEKGFEDYTIITFEKPSVLIALNAGLLFVNVYISIREYIKGRRLGWR